MIKKITAIHSNCLQYFSKNEINNFLIKILHKYFPGTEVILTDVVPEIETGEGDGDGVQGEIPIQPDVKMMPWN